MSRKGLLAGLMEPQLPTGNAEKQGTPTELPRPQTAAAFGVGGAIGAVSRSIEQIKSQAIAELDPALVDPSVITDRLECSSEAHTELVASIRDHGQQVPILVRPHPEKVGRYQIAYGRRRLKAVAELGRKVRAMVKPLTDQELVVAQGQENSARTDLSFIEKALFAARLEEGGYTRDTIMAALTVDKTGLSRLISSAVKIPREIIEAVGPAPKAGRDRWVALASKLEGAAALKSARAAIASKAFDAKATDDRFAFVFMAATGTAGPAIKDSVASSANVSAIKSNDGAMIARVKEDKRGMTFAIAEKDAGAFGRYLAKALPDLFAEFKRRVDRSSS